MADAHGTRSPGGALALAAICLAQFMVALDVAIVNIALPPIQAALHFSTSGLTWVVGAYTLSYGGLLLLGGRMADAFGRRRTFLAGLALFTLASLACGLATSAGALIAARFVQGIGAAAVSPAALSLIPAAVPPQRRVGALAAYAAMTGFGIAAGEVLGGVLSGTSWRGIFWINVPVGAALLILAPAALRGVVEQPAGRRLKAMGVLTATAAAVCIVYGATSAGAHGWNRPFTIATLLAGAVLLGVFAAIESRSDDPLLPPELLRGWGRSSAYTTTFLLFGGSYAVFFFVTVFDQELGHYSPLETGFAFLPFGLSVIAASVAAKRYVSAFGAQPFVVTGSALGVAACALLAVMRPGDDYFTFQGPGLLLLGIGAGLTTVGNTVLCVQGADPVSAGVASGILGAARQIGGSLGVAVIPAIAGTVTGDRTGRGSLSDTLSAEFRLGFLIAAGVALAAVALSTLALGRRRVPVLVGG